MQKLYLDCDGVILDTIDITYRMIKEKGLTEEKDIRHFYRTIDWNNLIIEAGEINDSIEKIKELSKYYDIEILTHVISEREIIAKLKYFGEVLPDINVLVVPKERKKADFITPNGAILVDDYIKNLEYWHEKGGESILFSKKEKLSQFKNITDLLELLNKIKVGE